MTPVSCAGCGAEAAAHPIVCIMREQDVPAGAVPMTASSRRGFVGLPVCGACHRDPARRRRTLKGHFFDRQHAGRAVSAAGSHTLG